MGNKSDFLFAMPSFWSGVARLLDLMGVFDDYNRSETPNEADARAMYADWAMVGQDLIKSADQFEIEVDQADSRQQRLFPTPA